MTPSIAVFGEILWDILPQGNRIGGAPANLAMHVHDGGFETRLISAVGTDDFGWGIRQTLSKREFYQQFINIDSAHPTGTVDVIVNTHGAAKYHIHKDVAWDYIPCLPQALDYVHRVDAFCFGTLAQRSTVSRETLQTFLNNVRRDSIRLLDINLRKPFFSEEVIKNSLYYATHLKLNNEELSEIALVHGVGFDEESLAINVLFDQYPLLNTILLTYGPKGADVITRDEQFHIPAPDVHRIVDTVGAGDAFTAGYLMAILKGKSPLGAAAAASQLAARVCGVAGAWLPQTEKFYV